MSQKATAQTSWSLLDQGLLWKEVIKSAPDQKCFGKRAEQFVKELQQAAKPTNALQGLLLDRMASSHLRKVMLLELEAAYMESCHTRTVARMTGSHPQEIERALLVERLPFNINLAAGMMKLESSLDRGFHSDMFLLLQLQEGAQEALPSTSIPERSNGKTIDGDSDLPVVT